MITIKKISINQLPELVKMSYEGDIPFFENFYVGASNYMNCVNKELFQIYEMAEEYKMNYYKIIYQKKPIGYFVTFENCLYSFAINMKFRKKDILINWWSRVKKEMQDNFVCYLYKKNERAIQFLEKNRMRVIDENQETSLVMLQSY